MAGHAGDVLVVLSDLGRLVRVEADRRARAYGMTRAQWLILARVEQAPGLSQRELAELVEVEPITVARLVDRLAARRLVERRPDPLDRRIWRLYAGTEAEAVLTHLERQREAIAALLTDGVGRENLDQATAVLARMRDNMVAHRRPARPALQEV